MLIYLYFLHTELTLLLFQMYFLLHKFNVKHYQLVNYVQSVKSQTWVSTVKIKKSDSILLRINIYPAVPSESFVKIFVWYLFLKTTIEGLGMNSKICVSTFT